MERIEEASKSEVKLSYNKRTNPLTPFGKTIEDIRERFQFHFRHLVDDELLTLGNVQQISRLSRNNNTATIMKDDTKKRLTDNIASAIAIYINHQTNIPIEEIRFQLLEQLSTSLELTAQEGINDRYYQRIGKRLVFLTDLDPKRLHHILHDPRFSSKAIADSFKQYIQNIYGERTNIG